MGVQEEKKVVPGTEPNIPRTEEGDGVQSGTFIEQANLFYFHSHRQILQKLNILASVIDHFQEHAY